MRPKLLSGGIPQIAKADGDAPVQACIAAVPVAPGGPKDRDVRYLDIREDDTLDEALLGRWILPSAALPGWVP